MLANHSRDVNVAARLGYRPGRGIVGRVLGLVPGEQCLVARVHEKTLELPRLPDALDGLRILHLSDFHFTGRIQPAYFDEVVRLANETPADLIALTGDFVDKTACIDWIPSTIGKLSARHGVYFVLGNHDRKVVDVARLRRVLVDCGFVDLGGRWQSVEIAGRTIVLAGNEMPWLGPLPDLSTCPGNEGDRWPLRILLAHTPDQWPWAVRNDFDLMLAGHTHGGQVCLPIVGPIFCPSNIGRRNGVGRVLQTADGDPRHPRRIGRIPSAMELPAGSGQPGPAGPAAGLDVSGRLPSFAALRVPRQFRAFTDYPPGR